jgi:hypothetical protein
MCTVLWDTRAQISLVTHQYAKEWVSKVILLPVRFQELGQGI